MVAAGEGLTDTDYVCVMKTKQAELDCIVDISRQNFVPLFEAPRRDRAAKLGKKWGTDNHVCWVQPFNMEGFEDADWGTEIEGMFEDLRTIGASAVPVATVEEVPAAVAAL